MLVLTRKANEIILIDENIKVKVIKIKGNAVQLGIEAPVSVNIKREKIDNGTQGRPWKSKYNI